jgi:hypothetical protein
MFVVGPHRRENPGTSGYSTPLTCSSRAEPSSTCPPRSLWWQSLQHPADYCAYYFRAQLVGFQALGASQQQQQRRVSSARLALATPSGPVSLRTGQQPVCRGHDVEIRACNNGCDTVIPSDSMSVPQIPRDVPYPPDGA